MNYERSPYWYPRLDRWILATAVVLLAAVAVLGLRARQQPSVVAPTITAPTAGAALTQGKLGEISGMAAPNAIISIYDGSTLLGAATADAQGNWHFTLPELAEGSHNLAANILSPDGKLLASTELGNITIQPAVVAEATTTAPAAAETPAATALPAETATLAPSTEASPAPTAALELAIGQPEPLIGKAPSGTTVTVREGDTVLGQTTADAEGKWQIDLPPMAAGEHDLSVSMTDATGNALIEPQAIKIKVETGGAPITPEAQPTVPTPSAGPTVGNLSEGATFIAEQPGAISGTAAPGAVVTISEGDTMWGQTKADIDGQWSIDLPALIPGEHALVIAAVDATGKAVGEPLSLTVNAVASAQIAEPIINAPAITPAAEQPTLIEGVAPPNATITLGEGETVLGTTIADKTGKWQIELPGLPAGEHKLVAAATDASGAPVGESQEITITVAPAVAEAPTSATPTVAPETTPPATSEAAPAAEASPTAPPTPASPAITNLSPGATLVAEQPGLLSGTAPPGATVVIKEGDKVLAEAVADAEGKWQIELPTLTPGQHELSVNAQDASGLLLGALAVLALNAVSGGEVRGPVINAPAAPLPADQPATLSGIAPPGATISLSEGDNKLGKTTADAKGNWQIDLPALAPGEHTLVAAATNAKGKPLGRPTLVVITIAPPATTAPEATTVAAPEATAEATPGATTEATPAATPEATPEATPGGATEITPTTTTEATPTAAAPIPTTTPQPLPSAPALLTTLPAELTNNRPTLNGVAAPGSTIVIFDGDKPIGKVQADAHGNWYFAPKKPLAPGEHPLRLEVTAPGATEPVILPLTVAVAEKAESITAPSIQMPKRGRLGVGNLLRGQAPANASLQINDGDQPLGETAAGRRGSWQFRLPTTLAAGPHTFRVAVIGPDGEILAESAPIVIEVINLGPPSTLPVTGGKHRR